MSWQRNASGAFIISDAIGRVCLDSLTDASVMFGIWVVICDAVSYRNRREFSVITATLTQDNLSPQIKFSRSSHMSLGEQIHLTFEAVRESGSLNLYCSSSEQVSYSVFRFWFNQSYNDNNLVEGTYGTSQKVPQILIDNFGRLVDIKEVIITPEWVNVLNKPTTVSLSGLLDALSTSSLIDCGVF